MFSQSQEVKLEWMYKGPNSHVEREEYLLGRSVDKTLEQLNVEEKQQQLGIQPPKNHVEHECIPPSIRDYKLQASDQVDLTAKLQEDPLVAIKKREEENRRQFLNNPIQIKKLQKALKMQEKSKKKKKKHKHSEGTSDDDLDTKLAKKLKLLKQNPGAIGYNQKSSKKTKDDNVLDTILMHKYNELKNKLSDDDLRDILQGKIDDTSSDDSDSEDEGSKKSKTKTKKNRVRNSSSSSSSNRSSDEDERRNRHHKQQTIKRRSRSSSNEEKIKKKSQNRGDQQGYTPRRGRSASNEREKNREMKLRQRSVSDDRKKDTRGRWNEHREKRKLTSYSEDRERNERRRRSRSRSISRERKYREKRKSRSYSKDRGKNASRRKSRSRSVSKERPKEKRERRDRDQERRRSRSVSRERNYNKGKEQAKLTRTRSTSKERRIKNEKYQDKCDSQKRNQNRSMSRENYKRKGNETKKHSRKESISSDEAQKKIKNKEERSKYTSSSDSSSSSDTEDSYGNPKQKTKTTWGLVRADGTKIPLSKKGDSTSKRPKAQETKIPDYRKREKLTEEEKEKRRREMMQNAMWRDLERVKNVKRYHENEAKESEEQKKYDPEFLQKQLLKSANSSSVESRIKSNINNIQRSGNDMNRHFSKR